MTNAPIINNNSDLSIVCGCCGCSFNGAANYYIEIVKMYMKHLEAHA